ncbi:hypothetical protein BRADI_1g55954v3 [Brachypodium distachyon]|uniref:Uncharacterized protein n=1 Tax=Brachypodium distachyon TaxID=15368 RepID=A0A2K2DRN5_BRADI|nr:hypothetical protein BRADI_1g55954v3 [Brachypodium distachyon]
MTPATLSARMSSPSVIHLTGQPFDRDVLPLQQSPTQTSTWTQPRLTDADLDVQRSLTRCRVLFDDQDDLPLLGDRSTTMIVLSDLLNVAPLHSHRLPDPIR